VGTSVELLGKGVNENTSQADDFCLTHGDVWSTDTLWSPSPQPYPSRGNGSGRRIDYHSEVSHPLWTGENQWYLSEAASVPGCNAVRRSPLQGLRPAFSAGGAGIGLCCRVYWRVHDWGPYQHHRAAVDADGASRGGAKVAHAVDLPVITDAGTGYGDPLHVMRCVRSSKQLGSPASTSRIRSIPNAPPITRAWSTSSR
jgi:hypothetical protein